MIPYTFRFPKLPNRPEELTKWAIDLEASLSRLYQLMAIGLNSSPKVTIKDDTGDPTVAEEGMLVINTFDNKVKMYADGAWRQLATW